MKKHFIRLPDGLDIECKVESELVFGPTKEMGFVVSKKKLQDSDKLEKQIECVVNRYGFNKPVTFDLMTIKQNPYNENGHYFLTIRDVFNTNMITELK